MLSKSSLIRVRPLQRQSDEISIPGASIDIGIASAGLTADVGIGTSYYNAGTLFSKAPNGLLNYSLASSSTGL